MNADIISEWYPRQGHHVIYTAGSFWYDGAQRIYQAFPFDLLIEPSETKLRVKLLKHGIL